MPSPREAELLQQLALLQTEQAAWQTEQARLRTQLAETLQENQFLRQKVEALARRLFGKKSEQLNPAQLQLLFQELEAPGPALGKPSGPPATEAEPARPAPASRPRRARAPRLPAHLPVVEEIIIPLEVQAEPAAFRPVGEEVSERLEFVPARFQIRRTIRRKYVRRGQVDALPLVAPLPPCLQERSLATPSLVAQIVTAKYYEHLPLYRQEQIYWQRHQVWLPRQTMVQWLRLAVFWLRPLYELIAAEVFAGDYVQIDETPIRYLDPGRGQAARGYLWTAHRPGGGVAFYWQPSRAASCLDAIVPPGFRRFVQCDGYAAYDAFARRSAGGLVLVGCWTHARRYFVEAQAEAPRAVGLVLHLLQGLYRLETTLRAQRAPAAERARRRQQAAAPLVRRLKLAIDLWQAKRRFLPASRAGQAITYLLGQWDSLQHYLAHGQLEIDQNLVENAIRPTAIGKKNWLFFGEVAAGETGAILYTIIENCRRLELDPYAYLEWVLTELPRRSNQQLHELTPAAWARAQRAVERRTPAAA